ncbi:MAG: exopolysaccharide biosynthesis polyprenyl glycosylphosphotransferase [Microgenomates group bacterium Gr01-1014_16]|nr:MAG: exopolysaccharide biosynthesis polyprenyl glycosylphosphotransferase [Microgenomates group bacterium Gr01-1014_16]
MPYNYTIMSYLEFKRVLDLILATILGVLFFPVCIITAIAIKLESPDGPVFADTPKRVGKNGKPFYPYKFRSMIPNAYQLLKTDPRFKKAYEEQQKGGNYKIMNDPRVTKVGKFIRKYSIDEVPQFINVIRGDMSLIGPRPYYPDEIERQRKEYPHTKKSIELALSVKPGITGLWQVTGRSQVNFDKRVELDAHYAQIISNSFGKAVWYDLKILFQTPFAMLSAKGAV